MSQDVEAITREHVAEYFKVDAATITRETELVKDLKADSLAHVQLVMDLEEKFDIRIPDKDAAEVRTIGDVISLVEAGLARGA